MCAVDEESLALSVTGPRQLKLRKRKRLLEFKFSESAALTSTLTTCSGYGGWWSCLAAGLETEGGAEGSGCCASCSAIRIHRVARAARAPPAFLQCSSSPSAGGLSDHNASGDQVDWGHSRS